MTSRTLKHCLKEGNALLLPPNPLPNDASGLCKRLGLDTSSNQTIPGLQLLVGQKCLDLLVEMQVWLGKEYWPVTCRDGLGSSDFLLGTADLRLIRSLCSNAIDVLLLPLSVRYHETPLKSSEDIRSSFGSTIHALLDLLFTPQPPISSPGPSTRPNLPLTAIGQVLMVKHLPQIFLSTVLLSYTPTTPPPVHQDLRTRLMRIIGKFNPSMVISTLGTAIRLIKGKSEDKEDGLEKWKRDWPGYVQNRLGWLMSCQVRRPGGIKAIMENVFGENAVLQGGKGVDTNKLDMVARAISEPSRNAPVAEWLPQTLDSLLSIISPPPSSTSPLLFTHSACYTVYHLWLSHRGDVSTHLKQRLQAPIRACEKCDGVDTPEQFVFSHELSTSISTVQALSIHTPFSAEFLDFLITPILPALIFIRYTLQAASHPDAPIEISTSSPTTAPRPDESDIPDMIRQLIVTWTKDIELEVAVKGIMDVLQSDRIDEKDLAEMILEAERPDLSKSVVETYASTEAGGKGDEDTNKSLQTLASILNDQISSHIATQQAEGLGETDDDVETERLQALAITDPDPVSKLATVS